MSPADGAPGSEEELKQQQQRCAEELASARSSYRGPSQPDTPTVPSSSAQTPSVPGTPSAASSSMHIAAMPIIPKIDETPTLPPETPGSTGSDHSSPFLSDGATGISRDYAAMPRGSIPGGEKGRSSSRHSAHRNREARKLISL